MPKILEAWLALAWLEIGLAWFWLGLIFFFGLTFWLGLILWLGFIFWLDFLAWLDIFFWLNLSDTNTTLKRCVVFSHNKPLEITNINERRRDQCFKRDGFYVGFPFFSLVLEKYRQKNGDQKSSRGWSLIQTWGKNLAIWHTSKTYIY